MRMSTPNSIGNRRQMLTGQHPLRKQRSLIETGFTIPNRKTSANTTFLRSDRGKYSILQRQLSIDQVNSKSARDKCKNAFSPSIYGRSTSLIKNNETTECTNNNNTSKTIFGNKKRSQSATCGGGDIRKERLPGDYRLRKSSKGTEDRVNLDIFLVQGSTANDVKSDLGSSTESFDSVKEDPDICLKQEPSKPIQSFENADNIISLTGVSLNTSTQLSILNKRPPLIRAMSAPVRPLDENSKNILSNKKKPRRRKPLVRNILCQSSQEHTVIETATETNGNENDDNLGERGRRKGAKKTIARTRSTLGCDVVTLVSLISSEGSDSDKDVSPVRETVPRRPPPLRKSGKSEHDSHNINNSGREFPHMLRRGSIAPLTARLRANRPPTAPPGSIFIHDSENNEIKMSNGSGSSNKEDISNSGPAAQKTSSEKQETANASNLGDENEFPEYVKTKKERECWKLFQKMLNKGVSVSYDTILRGMLTPTELRQIQKQKELEDSRKSQETQNTNAKN